MMKCFNEKAPSEMFSGETFTMFMNSFSTEKYINLGFPVELRPGALELQNQLPRGIL